MHYIEKEAQWVADYPGDLKAFGVTLRTKLLNKGVVSIPAGTLTVFCIAERPLLMFQTLQNLLLKDLQEQTLFAYEPGSIVFLQEGVRFIPPLRFRDCRMPKQAEITHYAQKNTV